MTSRARARSLPVLEPRSSFESAKTTGTEDARDRRRRPLSGRRGLLKTPTHAPTRKDERCATARGKRQANRDDNRELIERQDRFSSRRNHHRIISSSFSRLLLVHAPLLTCTSVCARQVVADHGRLSTARLLPPPPPSPRHDPTTSPSRCCFHDDATERVNERACDPGCRSSLARQAQTEVSFAFPCRLTERPDTLEDARQRSFYVFYRCSRRWAVRGASGLLSPQRRPFFGRLW